MTEASRREAIKYSAAGAAAIGAALLSKSVLMAQPAATELSFEELTARLERLDLSKYQGGQIPAGLREGLSAVPASVTDNICPIYRSVRPALVAIVELPFILPAWRAAIKALMAILDHMCGVS